MVVWQKYATHIASLEYLTSKNISYTIAKYCLSAWGDNCIKYLEMNPYILFAFMPFDKLDHLIRDEWDIQRHDSRRLIAMAEDIIHRDYKRNGDTAIKLFTLNRELKNRVKISLDDIKDHTRRIIVKGKYAQMIGAVALEDFVETKLSKIKQYRAIDSALFSAEQLRYFELRKHSELQLANDNEYKLNPEQVSAVKMAVTHPLGVLCGGAGCGKTTVLEAIVEQHIRLGRKVVLLAPTGKAALRMEEETGHAAYTIAKFIVNDEEKDGDYHRAAIIVDESSMVDLPSMYQLLRILPDDISLLLVGDERQLAPVGPGLVFHLLVKQDWLGKVKLKKTMRQSEESGIPSVAQSILDYKEPTLLPLTKVHPSGCSIWESDDKELCKSNAVKLAVMLTGKGKNVQILAGLNTNCKDINEEIQKTKLHLIPEDKREKVKNKVVTTLNKVSFYQGDTVMYLDNDYKKGIRNGSLGEVLEVYPDGDFTAEYGQVVKSMLKVRFEEGITVCITDEDLAYNKLTLAYCMTTHKSQGSQYDYVILLLDSEYLVENDWLYTAVTRTKYACYIFGKQELLVRAATTKSKGQKRLVGATYDERK